MLTIWLLKGSTEPNWTFGWNNTFTWKNWTLNLFINAALGQDRLNVSRYAMGSMTGVYRFISLSDAYYKSWDKVLIKQMLCMQVIKIRIIETILIPISGLKMHHL
ncbi:hypothetical protein NXW38_18505 [Bacteroides ovatus]|nr:hypothetical protein [Bacteroides ovatus]